MIVNRPRSLHIRGSWQQRGHCTYHNSSSQAEAHHHRLHRCHHPPPSSHHHLHYINSHQVILIIISIATVIKHRGSWQHRAIAHSTYETGLCPRPDGHPLPSTHPPTRPSSSHKHCRPPHLTSGG